MNIFLNQRLIRRLISWTVTYWDVLYSIIYGQVNTGLSMDHRRWFVGRKVDFRWSLYTINIYVFEWILIQKVNQNWSIFFWLEKWFEVYGLRIFGFSQVNQSEFSMQMHHVRSASSHFPTGSVLIPPSYNTCKMSRNAQFVKLAKSFQVIPIIWIRVFYFLRGRLRGHVTLYVKYQNCESEVELFRGNLSDLYRKFSTFSSIVEVWAVSNDELVN